MNTPRFASSLAALAAVALLAASATPAEAYPKPNKVPLAWELEFEYEQPRRIVVNVPGEKSPKAYWYMTYTVTNLTDQQQQFLPTFELVTRTGKVLRSDMHLPRAVFDRIKAATGNTLLEHPVRVAGPLLVGRDQAKDSVAIWEEPEAELGSFTIFVGGLSGESTQLTDSEGKPVTNQDGKPFILFKTMQIEYIVSGDELLPGTDPITRTRMTWVMR